MQPNLRSIAGLAEICMLRVAAADASADAPPTEYIVEQVEHILPSIESAVHLSAAIHEQSGQIDEFEQSAIEDRLVNMQSHFDESEKFTAVMSMCTTSCIGVLVRQSYGRSSVSPFVLFSCSGSVAFMMQL